MQSVRRATGLKLALAVVGVIFVALIYPMGMMLRQEPAISMMLSVYVTLGVFLLLALRDPAGNRSLIAFTAWSSLAHAVVMGTQTWLGMVAHSERIGVAVLAVIGVAFLALLPAHAVSEGRLAPEPLTI